MAPAKRRLKKLSAPSWNKKIMPTYRFKATNTDGTFVSDTIMAASEKEAQDILNDKKLKILSLSPEKEKRSWLPKFQRNKFPLREKIYVCRNLGLLIDAGIPLGDAFDLLIQNSTHSTVKRVLQDVASSLREGETISSSLAKYPEYFGEVFLVMIKTGETSGSLSNSFNYLTKEFKQEEDLKQKVLSSLLYPIVIIALMIGLGIIMVTFVLPRLGRALLQLKLDLPITTRILLQTSLFLEKNFLLFTSFAIILSFMIFFFIRSQRGKRVFYALALKLPLFKKIILEYNLARFTRILSTLLAAGVPVTESLEISSKSLSLGRNEDFQKRIQEKLIAGISLSTIFKEEKLFPPMVSQIISVGEKTGGLDKLLVELSSFYQEEVENSLKNFTAILEPVIMIIVGLAIGVMVISIIAPIYSIISRLQI